MVKKNRVNYAVIKNLKTTKLLMIRAKTYIVTCNALLTPQVLFASGLSEKLPALGRRLMEQPMAFCQIILKEELVREITKATKPERRAHDHIGIAYDELPPNIWFPVSEGRPWHCQIHRDAFNYGQIPPNIDSRLVVDLRWFGICRPLWSNRIKFSTDPTNVDSFGMPQPSFKWKIPDDDRRDLHNMFKDMLECAGVLGGFFPGTEPKFMAPGLALHFQGTTSIGTSPENSVADLNSKVWGVDNLLVGGNGVINHATGCNPTLTSVAVAYKAARHLLKSENVDKGKKSNK